MAFLLEGMNQVVLSSSSFCWSTIASISVEMIECLLELHFLDGEFPTLYILKASSPQTLQHSPPPPLPIKQYFLETSLRNVEFSFLYIHCKPFSLEIAAQVHVNLVPAIR